MPSGPAPNNTARAGGWAAKKQPTISSNIVSPPDVTTVYGADAQFRDWDPPEKQNGKHEWSKNPMTAAPVDPRNATRRVGQQPVVVKESKSATDAIGDTIDQRFALHSLSRDETETAGVLINGVNGPEPRRLMRMLPTHHINAMGELSGYRFSSAPGDSCSALPFNRTMFHGTSTVQCMSSVKSWHVGSTNADVTRLTADMQHCVDTMKKLMSSISEDAKRAIISQTNPCFDCSPCNTDAIFLQGSTISKPSGVDASSRARDSRLWVSDEPSTIGIYHAFVRRFNHPREHRLFIVVTGGCKTACDQFMNINADLATHTNTTASEVCDSDEVWWLRKLNSRMRARLLYKTANAFKLNIPVMNDIHSFDPSQLMAVVNIETCTHDIAGMRNGDIAVYNECVDTTVPRNGFMCEMNPSEGFHLYKGPYSANNGSQDYGVVFGNQSHCGVFPTSAPRISTIEPKIGNDARPVVTDFKNDGIFCYANPGLVDKHTNYTKFDESFHRNLELMGWQRDNGIVEMMPIVVGVFN